MSETVRSRVKRKTFKVSVGEELVKWMDELVAQGVFRNRSHMAEVAIRHLKKYGVKKVLLELVEEQEKP